MKVEDRKIKKQARGAKSDENSRGKTLQKIINKLNRINDEYKDDNLHKKMKIK